ncbi:MAG: protoporphyrinogen oxidase [Thermodesulfobacteriota bacterium]
MADEAAVDVLVVGAGLSGLAVAHFLAKRQPGARIALLEEGPRPGGAIATLQEDGFLAEWGPHGFLDNVAESRELLADLDLAADIQKAPLSSFVRYICRRGRLVLVPQSPPRILASPLLSFRDKLRVLGDLWQPPLAGEPTVADWASYRFGKGVLPVVDAVLTGTYAGDLNRLAIDAVMPGVRRLEREHGSVLAGLVASRKGGKKGERRGLPSMVSFRQGMERLIEALAERQPDLRLATGVTSIVAKEPGWQAQTSREVLTAGQLVVALPVNRALPLLAALGRPPVAAVPEARLANVVMGFGPEAQVPFGFGYLAPEEEQRFAMGALFSTHMFPGRAPAGMVLVEALVGGRRHPERLDLPDDTLIRQTYADLARLIHLPEPPRHVRVLRPKAGIPQLEVGHPGLVAWRDQLVARLPGLFVCGFGWNGIGMNDMIKEARVVAGQLAERHLQASEAAAVKGVYV